MWNAEDRARVLLGGASDVMLRPSNAPDEFIARLRLLSRSVRVAASRTMRIGTLEIDVHANRVGCHQVTLSADQRDILTALVARTPDVVTYAEIARALGYERAFSTRAVREAVRRLRAATRATGLHIETVFGVGYRAWSR